MRLTLLMVLSAACAGCCGVRKDQPPPAVTQAMLNDILSRDSHRLSFENYGNRQAAFLDEPARTREIASWNVDQAVYILDKHRIGVGQQGQAALMFVIGRMPKGSRISIRPYYGGGGFPFAQDDLLKLCRERGISIGAPSL